MLDMELQNVCVMLDLITFKTRNGVHTKLRNNTKLSHWQYNGIEQRNIRPMKFVIDAGPKTATMR